MAVPGCVSVRMHTGVCLHREALGGRWVGKVGRGERERERGREGGLSDLSSHKDTNPIGTGPHPYNLI